MMQLLLRDIPVLDIQEHGICMILDFDRLPFALRRPEVTFADFVEWASNRTLSVGRSYAKEILNILRLSQTNRYAVCKACRGLSLQDSYWIRQDGDEKKWDEVNLFRNPLSLFVAEVSLSGRNMHFTPDFYGGDRIRTPELTTMGVSAKGWIRHADGLCLHKVGKNEIPADEILTMLDIPHIRYSVSTDQEVGVYLSDERRQWIAAVGEVVVHSGLFTSEDTAMVTFEDFALFHSAYGRNPYEEAFRMDPTSYLRMQIADYILNNDDRHGQNWGFLMDNNSGKLTGFCPLFDHDRAFSEYSDVLSQTTPQPVTLLAAAREAQSRLRMNLDGMEKKECPHFLTNTQWEQALERKRRLC